MADAALESMTTWFLFHFARTCTANVIHERRTQNAGDSVLGNDAAQFMRCDAEQRQIKGILRLKSWLQFREAVFAP
jgi:hypothetical protein